MPQQSSVVSATMRWQLVVVVVMMGSSRVQGQFFANLLSGLTGGLVQPGTPAVYATAPATTTPSAGFSFGTTPVAAPVAAGPTISPAVVQQPLFPGFGWLFPVYTTTRRDNCVVYEGSGNENLQQVSTLFGLNYANVLADNQGSISTPTEPLAGRSVLLCGQNGPPRPIRVSSGSPAPATKSPAAPRPAAAPGRPGVATPRTPIPAAPVPTVVRPLAPVKLPAPPAAKSLVSPALQKQALLQVKAVVDPKGAVLKDWRADLSHCTWVYVTCDGNSNVARLNMVYLGLQGKLPSGKIMKNLPHLKEIYLGGNELKGALPADWAGAITPQELFLNDNMLSGTLPASWGKITSLKVLSLPYNQLSGPLPPTWSQLSSLETLKLNNNKLAGPVPSQWAGMKAINTITLFNNPQMTGCVPAPWNGKGRTGQGFFQSPAGALSSNIKDATRGTAIQGFCCKGRSTVCRRRQ